MVDWNPSAGRWMYLNSPDSRTEAAQPVAALCTVSQLQLPQKEVRSPSMIALRASSTHKQPVLQRCLALTCLLLLSRVLA